MAIPINNDLPTAKCHVCATSLDAMELSVEATVHFRCRTCKYCNGELALDQINKILRDEYDADNPLPVPIYHQTCHDEKLRRDFESKPVTVTQSHLDMLNNLYQMMTPNMDLSIETNEMLAEQYMRKQFERFKNLDELIVHVKMMTAATAMASMLLSKKDTSKVLLDLGRRESERFKAAHSIRESMDTEKVSKKQKSATSTVSTARMAPEQRIQEKGIAAMMKGFAMTREQVIETLKQQNKYQEF